jgi:hydrogenase maturation factor
MADQFPLGKLPADLLAELLSKVSNTDPRVIVGPGVGVDAAVIDMGDRYLVAKTDPITFVTDQVGWYAVNVNANDIACMGGTPRWFLATLLMPENKANEELAARVFEQITQACGALDISLVGGHTEITFGIDRPIVMGCMLGEVDPQQLLTPAGVEAGDAVILAGAVPVEATAIIAREKADELKGQYEAEFLTRCANFLIEPGISVVAAARAAQASGEVHAMHDPTEGGLATGLWELAQSSRTSIEIQEDAIQVVPEGRILCEHYGLDPLSSIASGALLIVAVPESVSQIVAALEEQGISAAVIGKAAKHTEPEVIISSAEGKQRMVLPERDEITKLFETA